MSKSLATAKWRQTRAGAANKSASTVVLAIFSARGEDPPWTEAFALDGTSSPCSGAAADGAVRVVTPIN